MSQKWNRLKIFSEWWRGPMSPVAETWQVPFTESAVKDLFQIKLGIRAAKITKIFNGYVYITANYWSIFFPLGLIKTIFGICKGIKTAKSEWSQKALEHAKDVAESKKRISKIYHSTSCLNYAIRCFKKKLSMSL